MSAEGITVESDGTWFVQLLHDPEPRVDGKPDLIVRPFAVRIPTKVWARNIREASRDAANEGEILFHLSCSMTGTPATVMDRLDSRDYVRISSRVNDVLQGRTCDSKNESAPDGGGE